MSLVLKDRVRETTTVLGTNDATLLGAVTGFQAFSVVGNGNTCYYTISDQSGGNWEVGIGTYSTVGPTLARTTILASSNSGSIVSFPAGTKDVFLTLPAEVAVVSSNNPSTSGYVLTSNGTGVAPSWQSNGNGDVVGPSSATDNAIARFDGTTGKLIQNSAVTIDDTTGSMTFTGSAARIYGDFSNGTTTSRLMFQSSTTNGVTSIDAIPNGTQTQSQFTALNSSDSANASNMQIVALAAESRLSAGARGTGTYQPMTFYTNGSEQMRLTSTGLGIGTSSVSNRLTVSGTGTVGRFISSNTGVYLGLQTSDNNGCYIGSVSGAAVFQTSDTERMRIDSSGNVGIGTSSPSKKFVVSDAGAQGIELSPQESGTSRLFSYNRSTLAYTPLRIQAQQLYFDTGTAVEAMRLDSSGNLGLGVTPSAYLAGIPQFQFGGTSVLAGGNNNTALSQNMAFTSSGLAAKYMTTAAATMYYQNAGGHYWYNAPSGTAGNAISYTQAMTLDASGNLLVGTTTSNLPLTVNGGAKIISTAYNSGGLVLGTSVGSDDWRIGDSGASTYALTFSSISGGASTERMRIDSSGNVGIGTTSQNERLRLNSSTSAQARLTIAYADTPISYFGSYIGIVGSGNATDVILTSANVLAFGTGGTTERMRLDSSGNLGLGVTPSSALGGYKFFELGVAGSTFFGGTSSNGFAYNGYYNSGWRYSNTGLATRYDQNGGQHQWYTAPSGTAGNAISFTQAMTLDANGQLLIGTTSGTKLTLGSGTFTIKNATGDSAGMLLYQDTGDTSRIYNNYSGPMCFGTANTERMRIDSGGNVGIGTTNAAAARIVIQAISTGTCSSIWSVNDATTNYSSIYFGGSASSGYQYIRADGRTGGFLSFGTQDTERMRIDSTGKVGIGTSSPAVTLAISGTDAMLIPKGTTAQQPTGVAGYFRFNTSSNTFEGHNGTAWGSIGGGATGGGTDQVFYENGQTVTSNYTITSGKNAMSAGPITINTGVTVTVPTGSVWTIV